LHVFETGFSLCAFSLSSLFRPGNVRQGFAHIQSRNEGLANKDGRTTAEDNLTSTRILIEKHMQTEGKIAKKE
jgi:hypothetical protein